MPETSYFYRHRHTRQMVWYQRRRWIRKRFQVERSMQGKEQAEWLLKHKSGRVARHLSPQLCSCWMCVRYECYAWEDSRGAGRDRSNILEDTYLHYSHPSRSWRWRLHVYIDHDECV